MTAKVTMVCTGNAARSVMAALLLRDRLGPDASIEVASAGTLVLPDQPMSVRTRNALQRHSAFITLGMWGQGRRNIEV